MCPSQCDCLENQRKAVEICKVCRGLSVYDWSWDPTGQTTTVKIKNERRDVILSPGFSVGTVAVRGDKPLQKGCHHYWEIQMSDEVYGTDVMVGVGTDTVDLCRYSNRFVSLIGLDQDGWGLSYKGEIHHNGIREKYCESFGKYSVIGIHLDMWTGTLEFFLNRKPLGIAFRGLQDKLLYPLISSTSARSGMNLIFSRSFPTSLQVQSLLTIGKHIFLPKNMPLFQCLDLPPGLLVFLKNNFWWIMTKKSENVPEDVTNSKVKPKSRSLVPKRDRKQLEQNDSWEGQEQGPGQELTVAEIEKGKKIMEDDNDKDKYVPPTTRSRNKVKLNEEPSTDDRTKSVKRLRRGQSQSRSHSDLVSAGSSSSSPRPLSASQPSSVAESSSSSIELRPRTASACRILPGDNKKVNNVLSKNKS